MAQKPKAAPVDPLSAFKATAEKRWGKSLMIASQMPKKAMNKLSTGNFALDIATFGGIPRGRITRFWGTPRSTKTGSCLNAVAAFQRLCCFCFKLKCKCAGRRPAGVMWADLESKLADDLMCDWMEGHGVDLSALLLERPDSGDEVIDVLDAAIRHGIGLVVVDSIANMTPRAEIEKPTEDGELPGRMAKLVNKAMRKWIVALSQRGFEDHEKIPTILLINQIRGTLSQYTPETLPGGKGQEFATSLDVRFHSSKSKWRFRSVKADGSFSDLKKSDLPGSLKEDATPDYQEVDYRVTTSSCCPSGRSGTYRYWLKEAYGRRKGDPDNAATLWTYAKRYNVLTKVKDGYALKVPEEWAKSDEEREASYCQGSKMDECMTAFRDDAKAQAVFWDLFVRELCKG